MTGKALLLAATLLALPAAQAQGEEVEHRGHLVDHRAPTATCLSCHDGVVASSISSCIGNKCRIYGGRSPIAPRYPVGGSRKFASEAEILAAGLELENGTVGCSTCHDLRNRHIRALMVTVPSGKTLCTICHML